MIGNVWEWTSDWYSPSTRRRAEGLLHSAESARRADRRELRSAPAGDPHPAQGAEGRLASLRAELLPALPTRCAPSRANRYLDEPVGFLRGRARRRWAGAAQPIPPPAAGGKKPNILVIFGDDIGQTNVSAYSMGLMGYRTPNIDRIAKEGMIFTDYYAEQSCTAGRSSFITGQCTFRTGLSKVGVPGVAGRACRRKTRRSPSCSSRTATRPASSARTTSATGTSILPTSTGSTSSSATSTT